MSRTCQHSSVLVLLSAQSPALCEEFIALSALTTCCHFHGALSANDLTATRHARIRYRVGLTRPAFGLVFGLLASNG